MTFSQWTGTQWQKWTKKKTQNVAHLTWGNSSFPQGMYHLQFPRLLCDATHRMMFMPHGNYGAVFVRCISMRLRSFMRTEIWKKKINTQGESLRRPLLKSRVHIWSKRIPFLTYMFHHSPRVSACYMPANVLSTDVDFTGCKNNSYDFFRWPFFFNQHLRSVLSSISLFVIVELMAAVPHVLFTYAKFFLYIYISRLCQVNTETVILINHL